MHAQENQPDLALTRKGHEEEEIVHNDPRTIG